MFEKFKSMDRFTRILLVSCGVLLVLSITLGITIGVKSKDHDQDQKPVLTTVYVTTETSATTVTTTTTTVTTTTVERHAMSKKGPETKKAEKSRENIKKAQFYVEFHAKPGDKLQKGA